MQLQLSICLLQYCRRPQHCAKLTNQRQHAFCPTWPATVATMRATTTAADCNPLPHERRPGCSSCVYSLQATRGVAHDCSRLKGVYNLLHCIILAAVAERASIDHRRAGCLQLRRLGGRYVPAVHVIVYMRLVESSCHGMHFARMNAGVVKSLGRS